MNFKKCNFYSQSSMNSIKSFQKSLLNWYRTQKRDLPWRKSKDPYAIWISEIMLQQTQVQTVIPYYERWIKRFPTIHQLAQAPIQNILKSWEGLGYYTRAKNLHRSARMIITDFNGKLPTTSKELMQLPGIGLYTANAIASIAYHEDVPVVDGNVRRVLSRIFLIGNDFDKIFETASLILVSGQAGISNQALMDLGAMICSPKNPRCPSCPVKKFCSACKHNLQSEYPIPQKKPHLKQIKTFAGIISKKSKILICQRPFQGLLGGLWELPSLSFLKSRNVSDLFREYIKKRTGIEIEVRFRMGVFIHRYTHLKERLYLYHCKYLKKPNKPLPRDWRWVNPQRSIKYPLTGLSLKILDQHFKKD